MNDLRSTSGRRRVGRLAVVAAATMSGVGVVSAPGAWAVEVTGTSSDGNGDIHTAWFSADSTACIEPTTRSFSVTWSVRHQGDEAGTVTGVLAANLPGDSALRSIETITYPASVGGATFTATFNWGSDTYPGAPTYPALPLSITVANPCPSSPTTVAPTSPPATVAPTTPPTVGATVVGPTVTPTAAARPEPTSPPALVDTTSGSVVLPTVSVPGGPGAVTALELPETGAGSTTLLLGLASALLILGCVLRLRPGRPR